MTEVEDKIASMLGYLRRVSTRYLPGDYQGQMDLVSDTVVRALKKQHQFKPGTNLRGWLYMVMRTVYITQFRREKKRNTVCIGDISEPSFSEKLELEGREFIQKVLENVPKHQRDVLEMSIFGDLSYAEIAERLKIPEGTVMSRRHRGVRLARAEYERISA